MICIPIKGPSVALAKEQMQHAIALADLVELRLDLFAEKDLKTIKDLIKDYPLPLIFTLKEQDEELLSLMPAYCDLPYGSTLKVQASTKLILSYHCFENTHPDLSSLLYQMQKTPAHYYKIAVMGSSLDALKMQAFLQKAPANVIGICMGEKGSFLRTFPSPITYASLSDELKTAPGQLRAEELINTYHYPNFADLTFGLIGSPISQSISHLTHNRVMKDFGISARYVKIEVLPDEIEEFLKAAKDLGILGLSVTMPLKEKILKYVQVDSLTQEVGAVNTLILQEGEYRGYNTDGKGALEAIETHIKVKGKKIAILGTGGAAKAIVYEAKRRGADVLLIGRTAEKACHLAEQLKVQGGGFDLLKSPYEILVNATASIDPIDSQEIREGVVVMDIHTIPIWTPFLLSARNKQCSLIFGLEMFVNQAAHQFKLWFPELGMQQVKNLLTNASQEALSIIDRQRIEEDQRLLSGVFIP